MSVMLPQLMGSLLFLTKLEMRRKQEVARVRRKHRRETMWVAYNQMKPINIQQKAENGFAAVDCRC
ncbi:hypothetical protein MUK42_09892 [Musa troglodytarum]|uniref:Uncharacterized protein n=1 Tax=Musa troglodytarum TaxID=320322 RepID=A0A9E7E7D1_9LILI|nr:hypothetical protein MUK42_09892 [Musa troglodytarum]